MYDLSLINMSYHKINIYMKEYKRTNIEILIENGLFNDEVIMNLNNLIHEFSGINLKLNFFSHIESIIGDDLKNILVVSSQNNFKKIYNLKITYIIIDLMSKICGDEIQNDKIFIIRELAELTKLIRMILNSEISSILKKLKIPSHLLCFTNEKEISFKIYSFQSLINNFSIYDETKLIELQESSKIIEEYLSIFKITYNSEFIWKVHLQNIQSSLKCKNLFDTLKSRDDFSAELHLQKSFKDTNFYILSFFVNQTHFWTKLNFYLAEFDIYKLYIYRYIFHSLFSCFYSRYSCKSLTKKAFYYPKENIDITQLKIGRVIQTNEFIIGSKAVSNSELILEMNFEKYEGSEFYFNHIDIYDNKILILPFTQFIIGEIHQEKNLIVIRLFQMFKNPLFFYNNQFLIDIISKFSFPGNFNLFTKNMISSSIVYLDVLKNMINCPKAADLKYELHMILSLLYIHNKKYLMSHNHVKMALDLQLNLIKDQFQIAFSYFRLCWIHSITSDITLSLEFGMKSLEIIRHLEYSDEIQIFKSYLLNEICSAYIELNNFDRAMEFNVEALEIQKSLLGENNMMTSFSYNLAGNLQRYNCKFTLALENYTRAINIQNELYPECNIFSHNINLNLSNLHGLLNQREHSLVYCFKALHNYLEIIGENDLHIAKCYHNLGIIYHDLMQLKKAKMMYEKSLEIRKIYLPEKNIEIAASYNNLAILYREMNDFTNSLENYNKSLQIRLEILGENNLDTAQSYNNLGTLYKFLNDKKKSLDYYEKSFNIRVKLFGENNLHVATSYNNFGSYYEDDYNYNKAITYFDKSLEIRLNIFPKGNYSICLTYFSIGKNYEKLLNWQLSLKNFNLALENILLCETANPSLLKTLKNKINLCESRLKFEFEESN